MEDPKNDIPSEDPGLLSRELSEMHRRNRLLKIAAGFLGLVFLVFAVFAVLFYKRISAAKQTFETMRQTLPAPELAGIATQNNLGAASYQGAFPGRPAHSSLTVFTNSEASLQGWANASGPAAGVKTYAALMKYADRPIVKEFMAELKQDPAFKEALAGARGSNPAKVMANFRNMKNMDQLVAKYAFRPDFMKLMMEVMSDPELKPMLKGLPQGGMPVMPPESSAGQPYLGEGDSGGEIRFDPSAINNGGQKTSAYGKRKAPPDVE